MESNKESKVIKSRWSILDMPDQSGKVAIVTGANSGTGYEVSNALAGKGAEVIMACRTIEKGESAVENIKKEFPESSLKVMVLDLAELSSVKNFCQEFRENYKSLDILCNNAGIMATPKLKSKDGFELQLGTNHLGHFALTGLLLDIILRTPKSRIVNVSSMAHSGGKINFDDLMMEKKYGRLSAYSQSKLANLLFTYELQRKLVSDGHSTISVCSHPGFAKSNLATSGAGYGRGKILRWIIGFFTGLTSQSTVMGALPILYAATAEDVKGGDYYGPGGFKGMRGYPKKVESSEGSYDLEVAKKLWDISTELTKTKYNFKKS